LGNFSVLGTALDIYFQTLFVHVCILVILVRKLQLKRCILPENIKKPPSLALSHDCNSTGSLKYDNIRKIRTNGPEEAGGKATQAP
jgi:hypothetical protein